MANVYSEFAQRRAKVSDCSTNGIERSVKEKKKREDIISRR